ADAPRRVPGSRATLAKCSVDGPGIGSARSNRAASWRWQKYGPRNNSGKQTISAPAAAAARIRSVAWARLVARFDEHRICTKASLNTCGSAMHDLPEKANIILGPSAEPQRTN